MVVTQSLRLWVLNFSTIHVLGRIILCWEACPVPCIMFGSIPGLCWLDASSDFSTSIVPTKKFLQTFSNVSGGAELPLVENHYVQLKLSLFRGTYTFPHFTSFLFSFPSSQEGSEAVGDLCLLLALKKKPLGYSHFSAGIQC